MQSEDTIIKKQSSEPFVVMAKPVGSRCNLRCGYCYYLGTEYSHGDKQPHKMTVAVQEEYIRQYIQASPGPLIQFTWHGGEPTLAGLDFYRNAVELQTQYLPEGWSCWNNIQTNGILLDHEWCQFIADNHFDVGLSIDGTKWLHDEYRKDSGGKGTFDQVYSAAQRLKAHGVQPDLLCTVTSSIAKEPVAVYQSLKKLDTGWIQFIPIVRRTEDGGFTKDSVTGEDYGDFLCKVFDQWIYNDLGRLNIQFFAELFLELSGGSTNVCWMAETCGRVLVVEYDGSVYSCDHFVDPEHKIGDISSASLTDLVDSPSQIGFGNDKRDMLPRECLSCSWLKICNGACPKDRFLTDENGDPGLNYLCKGYKRFFEHSQGILRKAVEMTQKGMHPSAIMEELGIELHAKWKGVGRNDPCPCGSGKKAKNCCWDQRP